MSAKLQDQSKKKMDIMGLQKTQKLLSTQYSQVYQNFLQ